MRSSTALGAMFYAFGLGMLAYGLVERDVVLPALAVCMFVSGTLMFAQRGAARGGCRRDANSAVN